MNAAADHILPSGTVTFLFLDIERSTEHLQEVGPEYPRLLEIYRDLTEKAVSARGGVIFGSEGDGLFIAFPEAGAAVLSAIDSQSAYSEADWPGGAVVLVRMGIHTGTPTLVGDDYTGLDVHRAARIMSSAWGGQVIISETTKLLIASLEVVCRDLGWFTMKGLSRDERLYQLEHPRLLTDFPRPKARRREVEVPVHLTTLVGRDDDVASVTRLLEDGARVLTLTGPGGIGKSRIALAVAESLDPRYADGVSYVDLSDETDPERVPIVMAERLGAAGDPMQPALETLVEHLMPLEMLLVLDGFERVSSAAAAMANLAARCRGLQILVTSRVPLRIGAEQEYRVGPLTTGDVEAGYDEIAVAPAVQLFVDRARAVRPAFELTPANAATIRELVSRLDGIPLSIELAAARARLLPPEAILERLGAVLDLATSAADLPTRQQSLRATIEWSHGMLDEPYQRLLRRLGVFVDGWTVEAAEAVGGDDAVDIFLGLEALVAQSMIMVEPDGRMTMGSAMREFTTEQLATAGDDEETRLRHARYFSMLAETNEPLLRGSRQRELIDLLSPDWRNFRTAAEWALGTDHFDLAGSLYANTWVLAWQGDHWFEAEAYTRRFIEILDRLDEALRARVLFVVAGIYLEMGLTGQVQIYARPSVELAARLGDQATEAWSRMMITGSLLAEDVFDPEAREQIEKAVEQARASDDRFALGYALQFRGSVRALDGDFGAGLADHAEALELARSLDNLSLITQVLSQMAFAHLAVGDPAAARICLEEGAEELDRVRSLEALAIFLDAAVLLAFTENDPVRAITALGAANSTRARAGVARWAILESLLEGASMAAEQKQPELAEADRAGREMAPKDAIVLTLQAHHELASTS